MFRVTSSVSGWLAGVGVCLLSVTALACGPAVSGPGVSEPGGGNAAAKVAVPAISEAVQPTADSGQPTSGLRVNLRSGFSEDCLRIAPVGEKTRMYLQGDADNYMDVASKDVVSVEVITLPTQKAEQKLPRSAFANAAAATAIPPREDVALSELTAEAGMHNNIDADLIRAIVRQESGGNSRAVSHAGARGLMQLMPGTAQTLGVHDSFNPGENVEGGTAYFDWLLRRYHENAVLALAAYNAGPAAVDKYHGVPPFRETRAYVTRILHDFNQRKAELARRTAGLTPHAGALAAGVLP